MLSRVGCQNIILEISFLLEKIGLNSFRISIEWSRIEPQKGIWDYKAINHYKQMITSMRKMGLNPIVTLNHTTLPLWVLTPQ